MTRKPSPTTLVGLDTKRGEEDSNPPPLTGWFMQSIHAPQPAHSRANKVQPVVLGTMDQNDDCEPPSSSRSEADVAPDYDTRSVESLSSFELGIALRYHDAPLKARKLLEQRETTGKRFMTWPPEEFKALGLNDRLVSVLINIRDAVRAKGGHISPNELVPVSKRQLLKIRERDAQLLAQLEDGLHGFEGADLSKELERLAMES